MEFITGVFVGLTALVWWEILLISIIGLTLIVGTSLDRAYNRSGLMWLGAAVGVAAIAYAIGTSIFSMVTTAQFWGWILTYLLIGQAYSWFLEFPLSVRRAKNVVSAQWERFVKTGPGLNSRTVSGFCREYNSLTRCEVIKLTSTDLNITPVVNKKTLVDNVSSCTVLWPAYLVSLVLDDLFVQVVETIVDLTQRLSNKFVEFVFKDTFSIKS